MYTRQLPVGTTYGASRRPAAAGSSSALMSTPESIRPPVTHVRASPVVVYQPVAPTNSSAIVALVLGLVSFTSSFFLAGIVGIVFGHIARSQIKSRGERGNGMAVAALWFSYISVLFWVAFWMLYFGIIALVVGLGMAVESGY